MIIHVYRDLVKSRNMKCYNTKKPVLNYEVRSLNTQLQFDNFWITAKQLQN